MRRLDLGARDDALLLAIEPPLLGQPFGLGARDIDRVVVATRHAGVSLFPITQWPVAVYVLRLRIELPEDRRRLEVADAELFAWAELYPTEASARALRA